MGQGLKGPARHDEVIDAIALADRPGDLPGADRETICPVALVHSAGHGAGRHVHRVGTGAEGHVAVDPAGASGGEGQGVIARQIAQRPTGAAVADEVVVTGGGGECAGGVGCLGPICT
ncbi:hypothetical protein D3C86_1228550 [compost metagenome]